MGKSKKSKKMAAIMSSVGTLAAVAVGVAYFYLTEFGDGADLLSTAPNPSAWDGSKSFTCGGSQEVTLSDRKVENPKSIFPALISAGGNCVLRIVKCTLSSPKVLSVGGNAKVVIEQSTLLGKHAISAGGSAKVLIYGSKIGGTRTVLSAGARATISYDEKSTIEGRQRGGKRILALSAGQDAEAILAARKAQLAAHGRYKSSGCAGLVDCYADSGHEGRLRGRVTLSIGPDGSVTKTRLRLRRASKAVKTCIQNLTKTRKLENYQDPGGKLVCTFSGQVMGGTRMISSGATYTPAAAPTEKALPKGKL